MTTINIYLPVNNSSHKQNHSYINGAKKKSEGRGRKERSGLSTRKLKK